MTEQLTNQIFYPAIHESDEKWGMTVTTTGFQLITPYAPYPPKGHPTSHSYNYLNGRILDEFQLIYISRGKGIFSESNIRNQVIEEGTLFMLLPGEWHTYRPLEETGWEAYWVGFRGSQASRLAENEFFHANNPLFHIGYNEEIVRLFQQIIEHAKREEPGGQQLLGGIVCHMLGYLYHFRKNEFFSNKTVVSTINKAKVLMREHVHTNISPEEIAGMLNISYSWFRRTFRQYTGFSPAQYIIQLKVQLAKELLVQTNDSVKQIAHILNFETTGYFSVFFKRETKMNPLSYRAMYRKN